MEGLKLFTRILFTHHMEISDDTIQAALDRLHMASLGITGVPFARGCPVIRGRDYNPSLIDCGFNTRRIRTLIKCTFADWTLGWINVADAKPGRGVALWTRHTGINARHAGSRNACLWAWTKMVSLYIYNKPCVNRQELLK